MSTQELTLDQKLQALANRFYQGTAWQPKAGDYYTTSRADLELYRVAKIDGGKIYTEYCTRPGELTGWDEDTFTTEGFGPRRVHVPDFILVSAIAQTPADGLVEALEHAQMAIGNTRQNSATLAALLKIKAALAAEAEGVADCDDSGSVTLTTEAAQIIAQCIGAHAYVMGALQNGRPDLALAESAKWVEGFSHASLLASAEGGE